jgi:uncharacterized protein YcgL (UPF0745 family)
MQLELALTNTTTAEKLVAKFKAQHELTLWRIEQENKLLKEVEAKLTKLNQKLEQQEYYLQQHNAA